MLRSTWRLGMMAAVAALISPTVASGQDYTFGDWARDQGYSAGDVMPSEVWAEWAGIDSLNGISDFDWTSTPTEYLGLSNNQISSIESGDFLRLTNLKRLGMWNNQLSSIEQGGFSGLANLRELYLGCNHLSKLESGTFRGLTNLAVLSVIWNELSIIESGTFSEMVRLESVELAFGVTELNLNAADFSSLTRFFVAGEATSVSLSNTVLNQTSFAAVVTGSDGPGIGDLEGITNLDLSGIDFVDITDLEPLYVMDDLKDLWLVDAQNLDAIELDDLLDNLATIEGTISGGRLHMTEADFEAFNSAGSGLLAAWDSEPGHHVEFPQIGDVNHDTEVNGLDVDPFVDVLLASRVDVAADMNLDGVVNGLDVEPFVAAVVGGTQQIPEPSTLLLAIVALGVVGGWRKWHG